MLLDAIRKVARGGRYVTDTVADRLIESPAGEELAHEKLSGRELQVLQLLAEGLTTSDISTELHVAQSTVSTHLRNIRDKLGLRARPDLIRYAFRHKLVS